MRGIQEKNKKEVNDLIWKFLVSILYPWKTPNVFILSEIHDMLVNLGRFPLNLPINNPFVFS
jgi:hypothetical protein